MVFWLEREADPKRCEEQANLNDQLAIQDQGDVWAWVVTTAQVLSQGLDQPRGAELISVATVDTEAHVGTCGGATLVSCLAQVNYAQKAMPRNQIPM